MAAARILHLYFSDPDIGACTSVSLEDSITTVPSALPSPDIATTHDIPNTRQLRLSLSVLVVVLCLRIETIRHIIRNTECVKHSYTTLLPCLLGILDLWTIHRHGGIGYNPDHAQSRGHMYDRLIRCCYTSRLRLVLPATLLSMSSTVLLYLNAPLRSTYICPAVTLSRHLAVASSHLALPLDFCILVCTRSVFKGHQPSRELSIGAPFTALGQAALVISSSLHLIRS